MKNLSILLLFLLTSCAIPVYYNFPLQKMIPLPIEIEAQTLYVELPKEIDNWQNKRCDIEFRQLHKSHSCVLYIWAGGECYYFIGLCNPYRIIALSTTHGVWVYEQRNHPNYAKPRRVNTQEMSAYFTKIYKERP